ncbi:MAG: hypothetical protein ACPG4Z_08230 [Chitinophagales bacterium]
MNQLKSIYTNIYDINLNVYHVKKKNTIIVIRYFPKSSLDKKHFELVKDKSPMVHSKLSIPLYREYNEAKFDVN